MAQQTPLVSPSFAGISRTSHQKDHNNILESHHNHKKKYEHSPTKSLINRTTASMTSSQSSTHHISYHRPRAQSLAINNAQQYSQTQQNHYSATPTTSVSSASHSTCSASIHSNEYTSSSSNGHSHTNGHSNDHRNGHSHNPPKHLVSKSHHTIGRVSYDGHNHHTQQRLYQQNSDTHCHSVHSHSHAHFYTSRHNGHKQQKRSHSKPNLNLNHRNGNTETDITTDTTDMGTENNIQNCQSSIISRTVLQLIELGINPSTIRWPNITMQSHEYITILTNNTLRIIDTISKKILSNKHCNASSAMMNPQNDSNINDLQLLAMRDDNIIKVIHLNGTPSHGSPICKETDMIIEYKQKDDHILFWRWLDSEIIAFITTKFVYHWIPTLSQSKSKCIIELNRDGMDSAHNSFIQYINYNQSKDGNYLFVQGLTQSDSHTHNSGVDGVLTLYDINNNVLQPQMNAFGACFADLESFKDVTLFCYAKKEYIQSTENGQIKSITKLYIVELNNKHSTGIDEDEKSPKHTSEKYHVRVCREVHFHYTNDFVVSMVQCKSVLYAVTKLGCLLIFDISSGICLYHQKVSRDVIFLVTPFPKANGIVALDRTGKLTLYYLNKCEFNNVSHLLPDKNIGILSYNVYNNSFAIKYKDIYYESSFFLTQKKSKKQQKNDILLCVGHIKLVLCKALNIANIGYVLIRKYEMDQSNGKNMNAYLDNNVILAQELRFIKIEINHEIMDKQFNKTLIFYNNYGLSTDIIQNILSQNLFNYDCNELKIYAMKHLSKENNKLVTNVKHLEKKISFLTGQRLMNLSNDELLELEQNVNDSYLRIRGFIRGKFKCVVCYEKEKHILFQPCSHYVVCLNCSEKLTKCPVCNTGITHRIKVYQ